MILDEDAVDRCVSTDLKFDKRTASKVRVESGTAVAEVKDEERDGLAGAHLGWYSSDGCRPCLGPARTDLSTAQLTLKSNNSHPMPLCARIVT